MEFCKVACVLAGGGMGSVARFFIASEIQRLFPAYPWGSTDLDRLATFHAACKKTGRIFLVDEYQNRVPVSYTHLDVYKRQPFSQYVKNVALMNLMQQVKGEDRWTMIDNHTWDMILGKRDVYKRQLHITFRALHITFRAFHIIL